MTARFDRLSRPARLACAVAATLANGLLAAGVLGMFNGPSNLPMLQPSPQLLAATARCDTLATRTDRVRCIESTVSEFRHGDRRAIVVAGKP